MFHTSGWKQESGKVVGLSKVNEYYVITGDKFKHLFLVLCVQIKFKYEKLKVV